MKTGRVVCLILFLGLCCSAAARRAAVEMIPLHPCCLAWPAA